jgi:hypothetical protein
VSIEAIQCAGHLQEGVKKYLVRASGGYSERKGSARGSARSDVSRPAPSVIRSPSLARR